MAAIEEIPIEAEVQPEKEEKEIENNQQEIEEIQEDEPQEQVVQEVVKNAPIQSKTLPENDKLKLRENMMSVLDGMRPGANGTLSATSANVPMQVNGPMDTTSPNGSLPQGNVSMDQIMGLMQSKG